MSRFPRDLKSTIELPQPWGRINQNLNRHTSFYETVESDLSWVCWIMTLINGIVIYNKINITRNSATIIWDKY